MTPDDLEERLVAFAVRVIKMRTALPNSDVGKHAGGQVIRSATAPAAHYAEARSAESHRDFIHKMRLALKELNETRVWIKIIIGAELVKPELVNGLLQECVELGKIINASIHTTTKKLNNK